MQHRVVQRPRKAMGEGLEEMFQSILSVSCVVKRKKAVSATQFNKTERKLGGERGRHKTCNNTQRSPQEIGKYIMIYHLHTKIKQ